MKKTISLILVFALCLSLCACNKSEAVLQVEGLIRGIGEVTLDSEALIVQAEKAYNDLPEEEKGSVGNLRTLHEAKQRYDYLQQEQALLGRWRALSPFFWDTKELDFRADGMCTYRNVDTNELEYQITADGIWSYLFDLTWDTIAGISVLKDESGYVYVREGEYDQLLEQVYEVVDLATDDISAYVDFLHLDYAVDAFGDKVPADHYLIVSKVYEQGLVLLGGENVVVELDGGIWEGCPILGETCYTPRFGRMKGKLVFVKAEYVDEYVFNASGRRVSCFGNYLEDMVDAGDYWEYPY